MFNHAEWARYLSQALHTLASARRDIEDGDFAWACFKSQQAAEMAAQGFVRACGGHPGASGARGADDPAGG